MGVSLDCASVINNNPVNVNMRLFIPRASRKIAQRDADSIIVNSALGQEEQDEDDPYADFKFPTI